MEVVLVTKVVVVIIKTAVLSRHSSEHFTMIIISFNPHRSEEGTIIIPISKMVKIRCREETCPRSHGKSDFKPDSLTLWLVPFTTCCNASALFRAVGRIQIPELFI